MYYEINVSLKGKHFFATVERSIQSEDKLKTIAKVFSDKFPETEGYKISIVKYPQIGEIVALSDILSVNNNKVIDYYKVIDSKAYDFKFYVPAHLSKTNKSSWTIFRVYADSHENASKRIEKLKYSNEVTVIYLNWYYLTEEDIAFLLSSPFDYRTIDNSYIIH